MKFNAINITLINYLLELSSDKSKESIEKILDNSNSYQFVEFILNELNQNGAFHKDIEDYMSKNLLLSKFDKIDYLSNYEDIETIEITEDEMKFFERLASGCLSFTQNKPLSEAQKNNADASKYLYKIINHFLKENDKLLILAASLINNHLDKSLLTLYIMPLEEIADMINIWNGDYVQIRECTENKELNKKRKSIANYLRERDYAKTDDDVQYLEAVDIK